MTQDICKMKVCVTTDKPVPVHQLVGQLLIKICDFFAGHKCVTHTVSLPLSIYAIQYK